MWRRAWIVWSVAVLAVAVGLAWDCYNKQVKWITHYSGLQEFQYLFPKPTCNQDLYLALGVAVGPVLPPLVFFVARWVRRGTLKPPKRANP